MVSGRWARRAGCSSIAAATRAERLAAFMSARIASSEREPTIGAASPATWMYVRKQADALRLGERHSFMGSCR